MLILGSIEAVLSLDAYAFAVFQRLGRAVDERFAAAQALRDRDVVLSGLTRGHRAGFDDVLHDFEHLRRAGEAYRQAQELYEKIPAFPGVAVSLRRTERSLERLAERLAELSLEREAQALETTPWPSR